MAATHTHRYRYPGASALYEAPSPTLRLVTSSPDTHGPASASAVAPVFFRGRLRAPRVAATFLRGVSRVVAARFHVPPSMLARVLREADPVVTSGGGLLRFEGFSACASVYARADLLPGAYDGDVVGHGTTNVDFGPTLRAALAAVTDVSPLGLAVGVDRVELAAAGEAVVERKVPLPVRWLKGFVEVQSYLARLRHAFTLEGVEALRLLRALPRSGPVRHVAWCVPQGRGARVAMTPQARGVRVGGLERLRLLEELAPHAQALHVFGDADGQASAWSLDAGAHRFTLVLSADPWRGFSGEGQALGVLAAARAGGGRGSAPELPLAAVRAALRWQAAVDAGALAGELGVPVDAVTRALEVFGARGLVGFDEAEGAYFHRELPFDLGAIARLQPRLLTAEKLVAAGGLAIEPPEADGARVVFVPGTGVSHRVWLAGDAAPADADAPGAATRCTCPWFAKHRGARGPCKHVLAAQLAVEAEGT